jgi:hypothetical protein
MNEATERLIAVWLRVIIHLQKHLFHVRQPQLLLPRALKRLKRVQLPCCDLVLLELILCLEEGAHLERRPWRPGAAIRWAWA